LDLFIFHIFISLAGKCCKLVPTFSTSNCTYRRQVDNLVSCSYIIVGLIFGDEHNRWWVLFAISIGTQYQ